MQLNISFILIFFIGLISCNTEQKQSQQQETSQVQNSLNDGNKWRVNPEMKPYLQNSKDLLNEYLSNNQSDYQKLAEDLKTQNNLLIKSCTMQGQGHEELHHWLHPHIALIDQLAEAESVKDAQVIIAQLQTSFKTYNAYFE
ncbi:MAG: hypothetical protein RQ756_01475 [Flavobacteriaceae bacterium]|nr:hypothetical protein [Flavobacteriaceae bacterium]